MSETRTNTPSVAERTRPVETGAPALGVHFLTDKIAFVLSEEAVLLVPPEGAPQRVAAHGGAILASACDGVRLVTGGDDGKVVQTNADGSTQLIFADAKRRWIDHVALGPDNATAWSAGKTVQVASRKDEVRSLDLPSTAGGLAFAPKGFRLAIAHYNGATLWFPNTKAKPEFLEWKGSHLGVTMSSDGRFLITQMQEPMLHGWRLADSRHMRMSGYATRVRAMDWTADGAYLATGGSDQLILWPFAGKGGPMGKQPTLLAPHAKKVVAVACHPRQSVVAAGYEDGMILLVRIEDGAEVLVHAPDLDTPVTALAWNGNGTRLAFACEERTAGIVDLG